MKYQNQLEKIRDIELELEDAYAELEEALLKEKANGAILYFVELMFKEKDNIEQFRYLIDAFVRSGFYKLKLDDKLPENILNEYKLNDIIRFKYTAKNKTGEEYRFLDIAFDENHLITRLTAYKG